MQELLDLKWINKVNYPSPILDWSLTRKVNGKIISDLRKKTRERIVKEKGLEFQEALIAKKVVQKYYEGKQAQYEQLVLDYKMENDGNL